MKTGLKISRIALEQEGCAILEFNNPYRMGKKVYFAENPEEILVCYDKDKIEEYLNKIEEYLRKGYTLVGFISYEAGMKFSAGLEAKDTGGFPLIWLGVYRDVRMGKIDNFPDDKISDGFAHSNIRLNIDKESYIQKIKNIHQYIVEGDCYQVNFTCRLRCETEEPPWLAYARLRRVQPVPYSAYLNCGRLQIISLSPELFLQKVGQELSTRPMKGTCRRGINLSEDNRLRRWLKQDIKNRSENLMIVDLMRNDFGKLAEFGSVGVSELFRIEKYRTLFQMTSKVFCHLKEGTSIAEILKATFPPGSVTGTPKIRVMEIINELEDEPRKVYTGSVGIFFPNLDFILNVAIRTIIRDEKNAEMGIGGGVVIDSDPEREFDEMLLKSKFYFMRPVDFQLLETMLYDSKKGYSFPEEHLKRLKDSARYFGFRCPLKKIQRQLDSIAAGLNNGKYKIRVLLDENGQVKIEHKKFQAEKEQIRAKLLLADEEIDSNNLFLYHKTTNRSVYDKVYKEAREKGFFDAIFRNEKGYVTEGTITNLFLFKEGNWHTPALSNGLLPGIWRDKMINELNAIECDVTIDDLKKASRIIVGNSVRGTIEVKEVRSKKGEVIFKEKSPDEQKI